MTLKIQMSKQEESIKNVICWLFTYKYKPGLLHISMTPSHNTFKNGDLIVLLHLFTPRLFHRFGSPESSFLDTSNKCFVFDTLFLPCQCMYHLASRLNTLMMRLNPPPLKMDSLVSEQISFWIRLKRPNSRAWLFNSWVNFNNQCSGLEKTWEPRRTDRETGYQHNEGQRCVMFPVQCLSNRLFWGPVATSLNNQFICHLECLYNEWPWVWQRHILADTNRFGLKLLTVHTQYL